MAISAQGSFFTTTSGPGTFVAQQGLITAFADTTPLWVIFNRNQPGGASIYLRWLKLLLGGTAPATTISLECAVRLDSIGIPTSAATSFTLPVPANTDGRDGALSAAQVYAYAAAAALTTAASSGSVRNAAMGRIPTGVAVVGDEYQFDFGVTEALKAQRIGLTAARATDPASLAEKMGHVVIPPGGFAKIYLWWLTSTTNLPTWSWEIGHYEL